MPLPISIIAALAHAVGWDVIAALGIGSLIFIFLTQGTDR